MIKIVNYKTFADVLYEEVYVTIDNAGIHPEDEGYMINLNFSMYSDSNREHRLDNVPGSIMCVYSLDSDVNAIKYGYEQLKLLSSFTDSEKV